jgi:hypothetical protein
MKKRLIKQRDGQFIIIAVLFIATMIISIGTMLYTTSTYYKYEPWEEYLTLIGNIELSSQRLVELCLSNYTYNTANNFDVLENNLRLWRMNLTEIYPGYGVDLNYILNDKGLYNKWNSPEAFSSANVKFILNINSLGLTGYEFSVTPMLNLTILDIDIAEKAINVTVTDNGNPIIYLKKTNFYVDGLEIESLTSNYNQDSQIYTINLSTSEEISQPLTVSFWDNRGIKVEATK